ncbi:MAG: ABC transporter permease, partial [Candidatus Nitrosopolaris sp.]
MTIQLVSRTTIFRKLARSRGGIAGVIILVFLILITLYAVFFIPLDSFKQWNNPSYWIEYPKAAAPAWTNIGLKLPEHIIRNSDQALVSSVQEDGIRIVTHTYTIDYNYDSYPTDFMVAYDVKYGQIQPVLQIDIIRPDGRDFRIYSSALPPSINEVSALNEFGGRVFSTDRLIIENLRFDKGFFKYNQDESLPQIMLFSQMDKETVLKGKYQVKVGFYLFGSSDSVEKSDLVLGGRVYGLMGTDEFRRDLAIGILWGTPVALFIGLTVSIASIFIGLIYGVVAGYKGKRTDEGLMRINDLFYSLPT